MKGDHVFRLARMVWRALVPSAVVTLPFVAGCEVERASEHEAEAYSTAAGAAAGDGGGATACVVGQPAPDASSTCRADKIDFSQETGCAGDGSYELCVPDPATCPAVLEAVRAIAPDVTCSTLPHTGRVGCRSWERLCLVPTHGTSRCGPELFDPMTDAGWAEACALASLPSVPKLGLTRYP